MTRESDGNFVSVFRCHRILMIRVENMTFCKLSWAPFCSCPKSRKINNDTLLNSSAIYPVIKVRILKTRMFVEHCYFSLANFLASLLSKTLKTLSALCKIHVNLEVSKASSGTKIYAHLICLMADMEER